LLCHCNGDVAPERGGRLLNVGVDRFVHVNCALHAAETTLLVFPSCIVVDYVDAALARARTLACTLCQQGGATVGCHNAKCAQNMHFPCAVAAGCTFLHNGRVYCPAHGPMMAGPRLGSFAVLTNVRVYRAENQLAQDWQQSLLAQDWQQSLLETTGPSIAVRVGSLSLVQLAVPKLGQSHVVVRRWCHGASSRRLIHGTVKADGSGVVHGLATEPQAVAAADVWHAFHNAPPRDEQAALAYLGLLPAVQATLATMMQTVLDRQPPVNPSGSARAQGVGSRRDRRLRHRRHHGQSSEEADTIPELPLDGPLPPHAQPSFHTAFEGLAASARRRTAVQCSGIQGWGLFAREAIPFGELVIEYCGELVRQAVAEVREPHYEGRGLGFYLFAVAGTHLVIDATMQASGTPTGA